MILNLEITHLNEKGKIPESPPPPEPPPSLESTHKTPIPIMNPLLVNSHHLNYRCLILLRKILFL